MNEIRTIRRFQPANVPAYRQLLSFYQRRAQYRHANSHQRQVTMDTGYRNGINVIAAWYRQPKGNGHRRRWGAQEGMSLHLLNWLVNSKVLRRISR